MALQRLIGDLGESSGQFLHRDGRHLRPPDLLHDGRVRHAGDEPIGGITDQPDATFAQGAAHTQVTRRRRDLP